MRRPIKDIWLGTSMSSLLHGGVFLLLLLGIPVLPMLFDTKDPPSADSIKTETASTESSSAPGALPASEIILNQNATEPLSASRPAAGSADPAPAPPAIAVEIVPESSLPPSVKQALARQEQVSNNTTGEPRNPRANAVTASLDKPPLRALAVPPLAASSPTSDTPRNAATETSANQADAQAEAPSAKPDQPATPAEPAAQPTRTDPTAPPQPTAISAGGGGAGGSGAGGSGAGDTGTDPTGAKERPGLNAADNLRTVTLPPTRTVDGVDALIRLIDETVPIFRRSAGIEPTAAPSADTQRRQRLVHDRMVRAAQHGNPNAQYTLAKMLLRGEGRERNIAEAKSWLQRSAENGYLRARLMLGYLAARGGGAGGEERGTPDLATADMWFWAASQKNIQLADDIRSRLVPLMRADEVLRARRMKSNFTSLLALLPSSLSGSADEIDAANDSLRAAAEAGDVKELLKALSQGADVDGKDIDGRTAMINAAWRGRSDIVQILLDHGADIEIADDRARTPTIWGAINGQEKVVDALLDAGSDTNRTDEEGLTALMRASWNGHIGIVNTLLQLGADPGMRDNNDRTALDHALREGHADISARLKNASPLR